jgi:hypothetical protein
MRVLVFFSVLLVVVFSISISADVPANWRDPVPAPEGCTSIAAGVKAMQPNVGTITTHTNDCKDCDFRLALVPAQDYPKGAKRTIPPARFAYPRYIGNDKGAALSTLRYSLVSIIYYPH